MNDKGFHCRRVEGGRNLSASDFQICTIPPTVNNDCSPKTCFCITWLSRRRNGGISTVRVNMAAILIRKAL